MHVIWGIRHCLSGRDLFPPAQNIMYKDLILERRPPSISDKVTLRKSGETQSNLPNYWKFCKSPETRGKYINHERNLVKKKKENTLNILLHMWSNSNQILYYMGWEYRGEERSQYSDVNFTDLIWKLSCVKSDKDKVKVQNVLDCLRAFIMFHYWDKLERHQEILVWVWTRQVIGCVTTQIFLYVKWKVCKCLILFVHLIDI